MNKKNVYKKIIKNQKIIKTFNVENDTEIYLLFLDQGSAEVTINLNKQNIQANIYGIVLGTGNSEINVNTISNHNNPNTYSRVLIKGVFNEGDEFNYSGMIRIKEKAQLSDAYLKNDNLLIGDAKINSSPQLEIFADDVKASHGVTITTFDQYQKYYLNARGLDDKISKRLLISGFLKEVNEITNFTDIENIVIKTLDLND